MEFFPNHFENPVCLNEIVKLSWDKNSYTNYIIAVTKKWCEKNNVIYKALAASLFSAVLTGDIKVEIKEKEGLLPIYTLSKEEKFLDNSPPSTYLYNLYNKYNLLISDYDSDNDFLLGFKNYLLNKFTDIQISK